MWFDRFPFSQQYFVGPLPVQPYGLAYLLGFIVSYAWLVRPEARRRLRLEPHDVQRLLFYCLVAVLLGGRFGFVVADILDDPSRAQYYLDHPMAVIAFWQPGRTSFGGIFAVFGVMSVYSLRRGGWSYLKRLGDEVVTTLPLCFALVRFATFLIGSIPGRLCVPVRPWCLHFAGIEGYRYPAAMIEGLLDLAMFGILLVIYLRSRASGLTGWSWVVLYGVVLLVAEIWREPGRTVGSLTDAQVVALAMILNGLAGLTARLFTHAHGQGDRFADRALQSAQE